MLTLGEDRAFPATPESVPAARRLLRSVLTAWGRDELEDGGALVVTELVTNAVLHAHDPIRLVLSPHGPDGLRIEVHDGSPTMPLLPHPDENSTTGRGMGLVALLAESWGAEPEGEGKYVWCEISPETEAARRPERSVPVADGEDVGEVDLESWDDLLAGTGPARHTVLLGDVPTHLLLAAKAHVDSLVRELTLTAGGAASGVTSALPAHLSALIREVTEEFSEARIAIKRQALAADARGEARTTLTLTLPGSAAQAGLRYLAALEQADGYARGARLLTLASPPQHALFRRWYVSSLVSALERAAAGEPEIAGPTFEEYVLTAVDVLAELQVATALSARLHRATEALAKAEGPRRVAAVALGHAVNELGADGGSVLAADGRLLAVLASEGASYALPPGQVSAHTPGAQAHRTGVAVWVESRDEREAAFPELPDAAGAPVAATCAVPLLVAGHSIGSLELVFRESRLFSPDERAFLTALCGVSAQTLERARLDESRNRVVQRLTRLQAVTSALAQVLDTEAALDVLIAHAVGLVGATIATISLLDPDARTLRLARMEPMPPGGTARWQTYSVDDPLPAAETVRTGQPLWIRDVAERDRCWPALSRLEWDFERSIAVLPLHVENSTLGVLTLTFATTEDGPQEPAWEFLLAFADAGAQALERTRSAERVVDANRKLGFLADAAQQLAEGFDVERTVASVARLAAEHLTDWCVVHLLEHGQLRSVATEHVDPELRRKALAYEVRWPPRLEDPTGVGRVARTGAPVLVPDLADAVARQARLRDRVVDVEQDAALAALGFSSVLIVPLVARGRTLGTLTMVRGAAAARYGPGDLAFAEDLARRIAVAVDNTTLLATLAGYHPELDALERAPRELEPAERDELLPEASGRFTTGGMSTVLETLVDAYLRLDDAWRVTYVNREAERLLFRRRDELVGAVLWEEFPGLVGSVFEERYRFALGSGQQVSFEARDPSMQTWLEVRATPDPHGLSVFFHRIDERRAIEAERARANERLQIVAAASSRLAALLEPVEVLDAYAEFVVPGMGRFVATALRSEVAAAIYGVPARGAEEMHPVHVRHADPGLEAALLSFLQSLPLTVSDEYGVGAVTRTGRPQEIARLDEEVMRTFVADEQTRTALEILNASSVYTVPLVSRGRTLGAVSVGEPLRGTLDHALAEELAARAAVALDNALLYGAERRTGIELQRHLLPRVSPSIRGIEIATRYLPSTTGALTGGDFYEALDTPRGLVLALGDVVGHGMRSAARMGQLRAIVAALALQGLDPAELLERIAADVERLLDLGMATLLVCRYDLELRLLSVASAGHPPPLVAPPGGRTEFVELEPGPPLGVGAAAYAMVEVPVPPGSTVVLYSDGLVENRGESLTVGLERLRLALEAVRLPPERVADELLRATGREHGGDDDVALLVMSHLPG